MSAEKSPNQEPFDKPDRAEGVPPYPENLGYMELAHEITTDQYEVKLDPRLLMPNKRWSWVEKGRMAYLFLLMEEDWDAGEDAIYELHVHSTVMQPKTAFSQLNITFAEDEDIAQHDPKRDLLFLLRAGYRQTERGIAAEERSRRIFDAIVERSLADLRKLPADDKKRSWLKLFKRRK